VTGHSGDKTEFVPAQVVPVIDGNADTPRDQLKRTPLGEQMNYPLGEWEDATTIPLVSAPWGPKGEAYVCLKHDSNKVYVLIDFLSNKDPSKGDEARLRFDTLHDGTEHPQKDDYMFSFGNPERGKFFVGQGTGSMWSQAIELRDPDDASAATGFSPSLKSSEPHGVFEFAISKNKYLGEGNIMGFAVSTGYGGVNTTRLYWPFHGAVPSYPSKWGNAVFLPAEPRYTIPRYYTVQLSVTGIPFNISCLIMIDGSRTVRFEEGKTYSLDFDIATSHKITAQECVAGPQGVRYLCASNSLTVSSFGKYFFAYRKQYRLEVASEFGKVNGTSWYDEGAVATFSIKPTVVPLPGLLGALGGKYIFDRWSNGETKPTATVQMTSPHTITALWKEDLLSVQVVAFLVLGGITAATTFLIIRRKGNKRLE